MLLLCDDNPGHANTVLDHIRSLTIFSEHEIKTFNPRALNASRFLDLNEFDVVVIHWSLVVISDHYFAPAFREKVRQFRGLKVQFLQDEYRWIDEITAMIRHMGIQILFTCIPQHEAIRVYGTRLPGVRLVTTLTGFVPENLLHRAVTPVSKRPIEIGYRGRELPYWLGRLAQEKVWIGQGVLARAAKYGLRCDIAWTEDSRIYGDRWIQFIDSCRAMLGTESGASIADFDGTIERQVKGYLIDHPDASFEDVFQSILTPHEGNLGLHVISPRIFEAIALHTPLVMFEGEYSCIVRPWEHYIPLAKDFSNMDDVVAKVRDTEFLEAMADRAYRDVIDSGHFSFRAFVRTFDAVLSQHGRMIAKGFLHRYQLARAEASVGGVNAVLIRRLGERRATRLARLTKAVIAVGLTAASPALRKLATIYLRHASVWHQVRPDQMLTDLLKLAIVHQAQTNSLTAGESFQVRVEFEPSRQRLVLTSRRVRPGVSTDDADVLDLANIGAALRRGRVETISWSHTPVGITAWYRLTSSSWLPIGGKDGLNDLSGIAAVVRQAPETATTALLTLLTPAEPKYRLPGRIAREPLVAFAKGFLALKLVMIQPRFARLVWLYARTPCMWRQVGLSELLSDILKLAILLRAQTGTLSVRSPFRVRICFDPERCALVLVSHRTATTQARPPLSERRSTALPPGTHHTDPLAAVEALLTRQVHQIVWDHSPVGRWVEYPFGKSRTLFIGGRGGSSHIRTLAVLAQAHPEEALSTLAPFFSELALPDGVPPAPPPPH